MHEQVLADVDRRVLNALVADKRTPKRVSRKEHRHHCDFNR